MANCLLPVPSKGTGLIYSTKYEINLFAGVDGVSELGVCRLTINRGVTRKPERDRGQSRGDAVALYQG